MKSNADRAGAADLPRVLAREVAKVVEGVRIGRLCDGGRPPLIATAEAPDIDLAGWAARHADSVDALLHADGAILFRGFGVESVAAFEPVASALMREMAVYDYGLTPRPKVSETIYKTTLQPAQRPLPLHNECSSHRRWPMRMAFCCLVPATTGGATLVGDSRCVLGRIPPEVRDRFERLGGQYLRDIRDSELGGVFGTADRADVEAFCRRKGYNFRWHRTGGLHLRYSAPAIRRHPVTHESTWFNHARLYLISQYDYIRDDRPIDHPVAGRPYDPADYDLYARFGDGTPIDDETIMHVHNAYAAEAVPITWQAGDVLLIDNMLTSNGRAVFGGEREVLLAMGDPFDSLAAGR